MSENTNVYYNPKTDQIGIGPWFTYSNLKFYLLVKEISELEFESVEITESWLDGWEYLGEL